MFKRTITYTDYNGNLVENEEMYFNITKIEMAELADVIDPVSGDIEGTLNSYVESNNVFKIITTMSKIILAAYGKKNTNGRKFDKDDAITKDFKNSIAFAAYVEFMMSNPDESMAFVKAAMVDSDAKVDGKAVVSEEQKAAQEAHLAAIVAKNNAMPKTSADVLANLQKDTTPESIDTELSEFEEFLAMKRSKKGKE